MRRVRFALLLLGLYACIVARAAASPSVTLTATFSPERLGHGTTLGFGFKITEASGRVPPPLTELDVRYPLNAGIATSGLGIATCTAPLLEASGPEGCPADSRVGYGTALAEIPIGPEVIHENGEISVIRAPEQSGRTALLFFAKGISPVDARVVFPGLLLPAASPFGGLVQIAVPLVPSLPEAPAVSVVSAHSTIGPEHLTYYERVHGKLVAYNPEGILLPDRCPRGGFPFDAAFTFLDGTHATARTTVPCPRPRRKPPQAHRKSRSASDHRGRLGAD
jgi:hypothetical protein